MRTFSAFILPLAILIAATIVCVLSIFRLSSKSYDFAVFNTSARITVWGRDKDAFDAAFREILHSLQNLHNTINVYDATSELSRLNASAADGPFACSDELWSVLSASREAYSFTEGAFDPTVGNAMRLWGFHRKRESVPSDKEVEQVTGTVGLDKVKFDDERRTVAFAVKGLALDFGGVAKGYGADMAADILKKHGIDIFLIDLGGNLLVSEKTPPGQKSFMVSIRDPRNKNAVCDIIEVRGSAVATSGNYERSRIIAGRKIGHIMDPRTCRPVADLESVTAITLKGVHSDAFSTAVFVGGEALASRLKKLVPCTDFVIIDECRTVDTIPEGGRRTN